ncbi:MAG: RNA-binding S4 domain-containing protein [bacterium]|jgi:ribosome-associated protein
MGTIKEIEIKTKDICLDQFLKWANMVQSGGEAKYLIQAGMVKVNGKREKRRNKKLVLGDMVEIDGIGHFIVVTAE